MCFVLILVFTLSLVSDVSPFSRKVLYVNFISPRIRNSKYKVLFFRIAGWVSVEQFLKVAGLVGLARSRVAYDLLMLAQSLKDIHIAETFSKLKTVATPSRMGLTPRLIFDMSRSCWDLDVQANAERLCEYLETERPVL